MAIYTQSNPTFGNVPAQTVNMDVPEEGEIFKYGTNNLATISGGRLKLLDPGKPTEGMLGSTFMSTSIQNALSKLGMSDVKEYNPANVASVYNPGGALTSDFSVFQQNAQKKISPTGTIITAPISPDALGSKVQMAGTNTPAATGGFVEGRAYKNPNNAEIFLYKDGQMHWIEDEETYRSLFPNDPNIQKFETLPTTQGLNFGDNIKKPQTTLQTDVINGNLLTDEKEIDTSGIQKGIYSTTPTNSTIASSQATSKSINDYLNLIKMPETATSKEASDLQNQISQLLGETTGQTQMLAAEEEKLGVNKMVEGLNSINNEIQIKTAALEKRLAEIQATPMTQLRQTGAESAARRVAQADIMFLQASAQAAMNNISFAKQTAQAAVDVKYNSILEQLKIKQAQLELIQPELNKEEKNYANALSLYLADQERQIDAQKETESQINNIVMEVIANNPAIAKDRIIDQIKNAGSAIEATQIAAPLLTGGYQYVTSPAELTKLSNAGYETINLGGRIYAKPGEVVKVSSGGSGGGGSTITSTLSVPQVTSFEEFIKQKENQMGMSLNNPEQYRTEYDEKVGKELQQVQTQGTDVVSAYAEMVAKGQANLSSIPNSVRNEVAMKVSQLGGATKALSETAIKQIAETQNALDGLLDLKDKIAENIEYVGPISGLQKLNPWSKARQIQSDIDRIRQTVGKALEGGVLRKEDEEKYKKILATITDTPETALYKIDQLINDIQTNYDRYLEAQQGAGRYTGEFDSQQSTINNDPMGIF